MASIAALLVSYRESSMFLNTCIQKCEKTSVFDTVWFAKMSVYFPSFHGQSNPADSQREGR